MAFDKLVFGDKDILNRRPAVVVGCGGCPAGCKGCSAEKTSSRFGVLPGAIRAVIESANRVPDDGVDEDAQAVADCSCLAVCQGCESRDAELHNLITMAKNRLMSAVFITSSSFVYDIASAVCPTDVRVSIPYSVFRDTSGTQLTVDEATRTGNFHASLSDWKDLLLWRRLRSAEVVSGRANIPSKHKSLLDRDIAFSYWLPIWNGAYTDGELESLADLMHGVPWHLVPIRCGHCPGGPITDRELDQAIRITGATVRRAEHYGLTHYQVAPDGSGAADDAQGA